MRSISFAGFVLLAPLALGCTGAAKPAVAGPAAAQAKPPSQTVDPIVIRGNTTDELLGELEQARSLMLVEKNEEAAEALDRLFAKAEEPAVKALAAYNAGLAYENMGNRAVAIQRYRTIAQSYADQSISKHALVRLTRTLGRLERWADLSDAAELLLARKDLPLMDQVEGHGARALALVEQGDVEGALVQVGKASAIIDKHGFGQSGQPPVQIAQVRFAEGEIRRLKSERVKLVPRHPNFVEVLEARCQGLLDAQSAFTDAMRARDSYWSAMSGFRVGQLYTRLHSEAMSIPPPDSAASLKQKQLFEGALRLRYRVLLEKGLKMMDATVRLGERTGEDSEWVARAKEAKRVLEQSLADEKTALSKLPYTEDELRKGLEELKARTAATGPAGAAGATSSPRKK
jgi:tetratricopeptide (TPR) repeat protein